MHGLGREVSHLRFSLNSKAEASRPTKPSERTPTALLEYEVMLWKLQRAVSLKLSVVIDMLLYREESRKDRHCPCGIDLRFLGLGKVERSSMDNAVRPSVFSSRETIGPTGPRDPYALGIEFESFSGTVSNKASSINVFFPPTSSFLCLTSSTMLSSCRLIARPAAIRSSLPRITALRSASTWANVPQGPPVRLRAIDSC